MYTPSEINAMAKKINMMENDIKSNESKFNGEVGASRQWWNGKASEAFADEYKEIQQGIKTLYSGINNLEKGLRKLATNVQQADEERRREKLRLEQQKKNKTS